jgi:hypothetical protein
MNIRHSIQVPTDGFVMEYPVSERPDGIQRSGQILALTQVFGHVRECSAQMFPKNVFS